MKNKDILLQIEKKLDRILVLQEQRKKGLSDWQRAYIKGYTQGFDPSMSHFEFFMRESWAALKRLSGLDLLLECKKQKSQNEKELRDSKSNG